MAPTDIPIGQALRNVRLNRGLTQQQVATRMECPRPYLTKVETGLISPQIDQIARFASALDIRPFVLVRYAELLGLAQIVPPRATRALEATV